MKGSTLTSNFNELSRQQLTEAAERFGIHVDNRYNNKTLAAKLIEAGITIDQIQGAQEILGITEEAPSGALDQFQTDTESRVVVKMDRPNRSFSIMGHKFTADHPYVVMDLDDAHTVCELAEGFRIAHPTEAAKFYKGQ